MAMVTSRDVREIVDKLSSDKVKAREVTFISPFTNSLYFGRCENALYECLQSAISDGEKKKKLS